MRKLLLLLLVLLAISVRADEKSDVEKIRTAVTNAMQGHAPESIKPSSVPGLYEVLFGTQFMYVSADGRYAIGGDMIDLKDGVNLSEQQRTGLRRAMLDKMTKDAIVFPAKGKTKHVITVFTDLDCGYCRKLHSEMKTMNDLGIEVRYLAFPRAGLQSHSYEKAVSVWCAKDRNKAMDLAKSGAEPTPAKCENTVAQQYELGQSMGVEATPTLVLEDGRMHAGYVPAQALADFLDGKKQVRE